MWIKNNIFIPKMGINTVDKMWIKKLEKTYKKGVDDSEFMV